MHWIIKFNQKAWLKSYIDMKKGKDMNTELKKKAKIDFEKYFFKLIENAVFRETMENARNHKDINKRNEKNTDTHE